LVEYSNDGNYIATHWLPTKDDPRGAANPNFADGYGYDAARVLPRKECAAYLIVHRVKQLYDGLREIDG